MPPINFTQIFKMFALLSAVSRKVLEAKADGEVTIEETIQILVIGFVPLLKIFGVDLSDEIAALKTALHSDLDQGSVEIAVQAAAQESLASMLSS